MVPSLVHPTFSLFVEHLNVAPYYSFIILSAILYLKFSSYIHCSSEIIALLIQVNISLRLATSLQLWGLHNPVHFLFFLTPSIILNVIQCSSFLKDIKIHDTVQ